MPRKVLTAIVTLLCLISCSRPTEGEMFLTAPRNSYDFPVEVVDSLSFYDFSFYTRVDSNSDMSYPVRLDISWVAPTDSIYRETVYMLTGNESGTVEKYRSYVKFPMLGSWTLKVSVTPEVEGFRGLGLIWKENRWDTTN